MIILATFCVGLTLLLSSMVVYIRDISNAVGILFGCMMFALPIMYLAKQRSTPTMNLFWSVNPLYYYIETVHNVIYYGLPPETTFLVYGMLFSIASLFVGMIVFKKLEKGFADKL